MIWKMVLHLLLFVLVIVLSINLLGELMEEQKAEDVKQLTPECINRCNRFNMVFYEMVNDGWLYDCWCIDDNKPFKVATLKAR